MRWDQSNIISALTLTIIYVVSVGEIIKQDLNKKKSVKHFFKAHLSKIMVNEIITGFRNVEHISYPLPFKVVKFKPNSPFRGDTSLFGNKINVGVTVGQCSSNI